MSVNHYRRAEELLEQAAKLEGTPRIGVARTLATMAQAHATLAMVKATRQQAEPVTGGAPDVGMTVAEAFAGAERAMAALSREGEACGEPDIETTTFAGEPEAVERGDCRCPTMAAGESCPLHDEPLPIFADRGEGR